MTEAQHRKPESGNTHWIVPVLTFLLLHACVTAPGVKKGDQLVGQQNYIKAIQSYEQALLETQSGKEKQAIAAKIEATKSALASQEIGRARDRFDALDTPRVADIDAIIAILKKIVPWDDAQQSVATELGRYAAVREGIRNDAEALGRKALEQAEGYQYEAALELLGRATAIDAGAKQLTRSLERVRQQQALFERVDARLNGGDLEQARAGFEELSETMTSGPSFADSPFKQRFLALVREEVSGMVLDRKWLPAIAFLEQWAVPDLAEDLSQVKADAASHYQRLADQAVAYRQNYHEAYIYALKATELGGNDISLFNLNKTASDQVDKGIQKYIAVASFDSPSNDPDAGRQFSDSLISYLYSVLPYGINILERDKIDMMLNEQNGAGNDSQRVLDVDLAVTGTVSLFKVDSSIEKRNATVKVKVAEQIVENPEFSQMIKLYGPDQSLWPDIPERTIKKDTVEMLNYTKGMGHKKGFAKVSVRIFDARKGTITFVKDYDASVSHSGKFQDEVADAGIEYIPLILPSDTEIKEEMRKAIVMETAKVVNASFEKRETRFLNQARFFVARKETQAAFTPLAEGHLYCLRNNTDADNPELLEIKAMIETIVQ